MGQSDKSTAGQGQAEKPTKQQLRTALEELERYKSIVSKSRALAFVWRVVPGVWPVEFVSDNVEEVLGYTVEDLMSGRVTWPGITHPEDAPRLEREVAAYLKEGQPQWSQEYRLVTKSGQTRWFTDWSSTVRDSQGQITHIQGIVHDITEGKRAEEALRAERDISRSYLDIAGVMLAVVDADEKISMINRTGCGILGYAKGELVGANWFDLLVPDRAREEVRDVFGKLMAGDVAPVEYYENPLVREDGEERLISFHNTVLRCASGEISGVLFSAQDITERKRAEEALLFERAQLLSVFDSVDENICVTDTDTYEILYVNQALKDAFQKELIGGTCYREFQGLDSPCEFCTNEIILKQKPAPHRWEHHNPTLDRDYAIVDRIIKWPDGRDVRFELAIDITKRKRVEEELAQQREQLRGLASELSSAEERERRRVAEDLHDRVSQNLGAMSMHLQVLRGADLVSTQAAALDESLALLRATAKSVRTMTFELCPPMLYETGLAPALAWLAEQSQQGFEGRLDFECSDGVSPLPEEVRAFAFRAARELLNNALRHASAQDIRLRLATEGPYATVSVEDDGVGFDPEAIRSGDPAQGGFGLFALRERARSLGGRLEIDAAIGRGSRLMLVLPSGK